MKKVLITGGLGFVGGRLARKLSARHEVTVSSRNPIDKGIAKLHGISGSFLHQDLLDTGKFPQVDTVIHLAALNETDCVKYPSEAIRVNIDQSRQILENAVAVGVTNFIYFSTAHVYRSPLTGFIDERTAPAPQHPYSITHRAAEDYIIAATLQKRIHGIILRLSNSFGAPVMPEVNRWTLLTNDLCRQAIEKGNMSLNTNGCQYRDFICLGDVEKAVERISAVPYQFKQIVYNLGAGQSMRVLDMARAVATEYVTLFEREIPLLLPVGSKESKEPHLEFCIDGLKAEGITPENNFGNELRELLLFCEENFIKA